MTLSTIFGSLAFFSIPFITLAFPAMEHLATLSAASIAVVSVQISLTILELYKLKESTIWEGFKQVARRLTKNPLLISRALGIFLSILNVEIPTSISDSIHMLGSTASTVAIFMLGVFLYGRNYAKANTTVKLSLLRALFLPTLAFFATRLFGVIGLEASVLILMNGMPMVISMIILSERYDFYREIMATLVLVSSFAATVYQNLWLLFWATIRMCADVERVSNIERGYFMRSFSISRAFEGKTSIDSLSSSLPNLTNASPFLSE